jgi:guanylate kinase
MIPLSKMILLTAPSGAGKTTIASRLIKAFPFLEFSISATTREARSYEENGVHYYFFSKEDFDVLIEKEELAEYEEVYAGQYYGTLKSEIKRIWDKGLIVLFDVDVRGADNLKKAYGDQCLSIFIEPPSLEILENRLIKRNTEDEASLQKRLKRVRYEMSFKDRFDKSIVNDDLEESTSAVKEAILNYLDI